MGARRAADRSIQLSGALCASLALAGPPAAALEELVPPELTAADVAERYASTVVTIRTRRTDGLQTQASGVIVEPQGTIATCLHVIEQAETLLIKTRSGDRYHDPAIRAFSVESDLALLEIRAADLPAAPLAESSELPRGEAVTIIGNPEFLARTVSTGIVSAVREPPRTPDPEDELEDEQFGVRVPDRGLPPTRLLQISAQSAPGSSGAPVFNRRGEVVGLVTAGKGRADLNFAIPVENVHALLGINEGLDYEALTRRSEEERVALAEPHLEEARIALTLEDRPTARREVSMALQVHPGYVPALLLSAEMLTGDGDLDGAEEELRRATAADPDSPDAWSGLGGLLLHRGVRDRPDLRAEAAGAFEQALELEPDHAGAARGLGTIRHLEGRYRSAQQLLGRAVDSVPDDVGARVMLAEALLLEGEIWEAVDRYEEALDLDRHSAVAHHGLARARASLGDDAAAQRHYLEFLELSEGDPELEALRERTILYLRRYPRLAPLTPGWDELP